MRQFSVDILNIFEKYGITSDEDNILRNLADNIDRAKICKDIVDCKECPLHKSTMHKVVGEGPRSELMIIGDFSGEHENATGRPFSGPSGNLLDKILLDSCIDRSKVYITNAVKCHPPYNRTPDFSELESCAKTFLSRELEIVKPKHIISVGAIAASLFTNEKLSNIRGKTIDFKGYPVIFTFHPSYIFSLKDAEYTKTYDKVVEDFCYAVNSILESGGDMSFCRQATEEEQSAFNE